MTLTLERIYTVNAYDEVQDISYLEQDLGNTKDNELQKKRLEEYHNGYFELIGIYAVAEVLTSDNQIQKIESTGLWGIESDSGEEYLDTIRKEQIDELTDMLVKDFNINKADIQETIEVMGTEEVRV